MVSIDYCSAEFMTSASRLTQCPEDVGLEVAFAGRSNAGKSSALNRLTGNKKLARTSKTPGRTQLLNFFALSASPRLMRLVDLPGYGFAQVPLAVKQQWERMVSDYFDRRRSLSGLVMVMDIRHPLSAQDQRLLQWCADRQLPTHILLTKCDKLSKSAAHRTLQTVSEALVECDDFMSVQCFSSAHAVGVTPLQQVLNTWLSPK